MCVAITQDMTAMFRQRPMSDDLGRPRLYLG